MKKKALFILAFLGIMIQGWAQSGIIDLGIFKKQGDPAKLEVRLRPTQHVVNGAYSAGIFTIAVPTGSGATLSEVQGSSPYGYSFAGPVGQFNGYDYYRYQFAGSVYMVNWQQGKEYPLLTLQINGTIPPKGAIKLLTGDTWTRDYNADYYQELNGAELQRKFYYLSGSKKIIFQAKGMPGKNVQLDWTIESETTIDFTQIEYSVDGIEFSTLEAVPGHEEPTRALSPYRYLHENVPSDVNFYRVLAVDVDGVEEYSSIQLVNFKDMDADFTVFPNPTSGPLMLVSRNLGEYREGVTCQLTDNTGRVLQIHEVGSDNLGLDLSDWAAGIYYLRVFSGQNQLDEFKIVLAKH